jgi:uncharacterized membrane protein
MFELLFKYPASIFQKGQFVMLTPWPLWLLVVAILAAAGLLLWHVRRNHGMLTGARPLAIWLLETAMVALLLFLLWHPALSVATLRPQQNLVAVMVDDSRSMALNDGSKSRIEQARAVLNDGLLSKLGDRFQVRLYRFGKEAERIQKTDQATASAPASRIGASLKEVLVESSSLPLGAVVLLSDGADNSGGVDRDTVSEIRRQRIPIHTIGFGREHPSRDVEVTDVVVPPRALPDSRVTAQVTVQNFGLAGEKARLSVKDAGKILVSQEVTLKPEGTAQTEFLVFNAGIAGPKTLEVGIDPISGEENRDNNRVNRLINVEARKPRILYIEGEPRWEFKFIRRALDDDRSIELASLLRTTQNKFYRQGTNNPKELEEGFPSKAEELFAYQGLIIGSVEASYFTSAQQDMIREFVNRRGGGVLFLGGRATLSEGGYVKSPFEELLPVRLLDNKGTFHRDQVPQELTGPGRQSIICRIEENPERNAERWKKMPLLANYNEVGEAKPGAVVLLEVNPGQRRRSPLLATQNYGRGRVALFATAGSWRWKMWQDHTDRSHATFWQQMFRYLVTDSPGQLVTSTPHQVLADETRVPFRVEVRDKTYKLVSNARVHANVIGPEGAAAQVELTLQPGEEGIYTGEYTAQKPGSYVAEMIAGREQEELGRDVLTFRREDGVAENFHTGQNRDLLEKLAEQTGGKYYTASDAKKLSDEISYSEAGITTRETRDLWDMPIVFLLALMIRATEWMLRRKWGVV